MNPSKRSRIDSNMEEEQKDIYEVFSIHDYPDDTGFAMEGTLEECREYVRTHRSEEASDFIGYIIYKRIEKDKDLVSQRLKAVARHQQKQKQIQRHAQLRKLELRNKIIMSNRQ